MYIITGASRGIGKFLMEKFQSEGQKVIGTYNKTQPDHAGNDFMYKVNIANVDEVKSWIEEIKPQLSQIVLLNCAGINYNAFAHKVDHNKWREVIETNLIGNFNVISAVLPFMRDQNWGRIINFSSVVAQIGVPGTSAYAASKSGMWGLSKAIAAENAKKGITINSLNLGYFDIGMISEVPAEFQQIIKSKIPTGNFGNPDNIADAVKFFIKSDYMNGSAMDISAGLV